jgi:hypothetical protein
MKSSNHLITQITFCSLSIFMFLNFAFGQTQVRTEVNFPDIPGYKTLICDLHMHTVFSDGLVWPTIRSDEAWREGLDVIAITDHIEYQPHIDDIPSNFNRASELAGERGDELNLIVIPGSEITRDMPPGHINAIFIRDADKLNTDTWRQGIDAAAAQGAFIFWNHPGWRGQQDDGIAKWYDEHTEILNSGKLHGIEVVNEKEYYPEAHQWCLDKDLTMLSNSDIHNPIQMDYNFPGGEHRPMTLVFTKDRSVEAIKEALFAKRTVVYSNNFLYGKKEFLEPLFYNSIFINNPAVILEHDQSKFIQITNYSDMDYHLQRKGDPENIEVQSDVWLYAGKTVLYRIESIDGTVKGNKKVSIPFQVENLKTTPKESLQIYLDLRITFK